VAVVVSVAMGVGVEVGVSVVVMSGDKVIVGVSMGEEG